MMEILLFSLVAIGIANILLTIKSKGNDNANIEGRLQEMNLNLTKFDSLLRDEFRLNREENQKSFRDNREELSNSFKLFGSAISANVAELSRSQNEQLQGFSKKLNDLIESFEQKSSSSQSLQEKHAKENRSELTTSLKTFEDKIRNLQEQQDKSAKENRHEQTNSLKSFENRFEQNVREFKDLQKQKFDDLFSKNENLKKELEFKLKEIRETVEGKLQYLQEENGKKLEEMRQVVDEKLQATVEKRFSESFKLISDRLEQVHKGLGEMQNLATGVGDLKRVLTNVKTRGNLGEIQLGNILEQILSSEQYEQNKTVKQGSQERVEFVVKLPGKNEDNQPLLLPIDSKFPNEDYQRLLESYENLANLTGREIEIISKQFENSVKKSAKDIKDKYINPPTTTDFAIMFVPTEGLYAEILRRTGLFESLQRDYRITVVGPTNLVAFLSSLHMGFKTLAIEKRSSEVWEVLGAIKSQFGDFGNILQRTKKKLEEATNVIDKAQVRTRVIERKLKNVQELPQEQSIALLGEALEIEQDLGTDD